jgi:hypothetical protein
MSGNGRGVGGELARKKAERVANKAAEEQRKIKAETDRKDADRKIKAETDKLHESIKKVADQIVAVDKKVTPEMVEEIFSKINDLEGKTFSKIKSLEGAFLEGFRNVYESLNRNTNNDLESEKFLLELILKYTKPFIDYFNHENELAGNFSFHNDL